jgi:hypothetical protein
MPGWRRVLCCTRLRGGEGKSFFTTETQRHRENLLGKNLLVQAVVESHLCAQNAQRWGTRLSADSTFKAPWF